MTTRARICQVTTAGTQKNLGPTNANDLCSLFHSNFPTSTGTRFTLTARSASSRLPRRWDVYDDGRLSFAEGATPAFICLTTERAGTEANES